MRNAPLMVIGGVVVAAAAAVLFLSFEANSPVADPGLALSPDRPGAGGFAGSQGAPDSEGSSRQVVGDGPDHESDAGSEFEGVRIELVGATVRPDDLVAECDGDPTGVTHEGAGRWLLPEVRSSAALSTLRVTAMLSPTTRLELDAFDGPLVHVQLPAVTTSRVVLDGRPREHSWTCALTPVDGDANLSEQVEQRAEASGATAILVSAAVEMRIDGEDVAQFDSIAGQPWSVFVRCEGQELERDWVRSVETPSVTRFRVVQPLACIEVAGDLPPATTLVVYAAGGDALRAVPRGKNEAIKIFRTATNQTFAPNTDYVVRAIEPDGTTHRHPCTTDGSGRVQVEMRAGRGVPAWRFAMSPDEVVRDAFVSVAGVFHGIADDPEDCVETNALVWRRDGDSLLLCGLMQPWQHGILVTEAGRVARLEPEVGHVGATHWVPDAPAKIEVGALPRFTGKVSWEQALLLMNAAGEPQRISVRRGACAPDELAGVELRSYDGSVRTELVLRGTREGATERERVDATYAVR